MDVTPILESLNDAQRQAVTAPAEPMLVIAGAGSGKTRVLVHRAAWLIDVEGVSPQGLLAVTFTNKAAAEMRGRIEALLDMPVSHLWIGTFHGLAHRLLRRHWQEAKLPQNFQIIDSDDQLRLIKRLLKNLEIDDSRWVPKEIQWFINAQKDEGLRPQHLDDERDPNRRQMIALYAAYEEVCQRGGLVDFAELLLRAHELWRDNPDLLAHYQRRFAHLLVDEFQDTNAIQYAWLRLLAGDNAAIPFVVGDDDQSIYRWRGARVEHIHRFQRDFPNATVVKLEQNYRSTATILNAANAVIANNAGPRAPTASRSGSMRHTTNGTKLILSSAGFATGSTRVMRVPTPRSCTAPMPSPGCWKRGLSTRAFPTVCTADCASSSAPRSRMLWLTCGSYRIAKTTRHSSAS
jgi:DNA helicase-2/ATP-dependent DNA helicase PcrA